MTEQENYFNTLKDLNIINLWQMRNLTFQGRIKSFITLKF